MTPDILALFAACSTHKPVVLESFMGHLRSDATMQQIDAYTRRWEDAGRPYILTDDPVEISDDILVYKERAYGLLFVLDADTNATYIVHDILVGDRFLILNKMKYNAPQYVWWNKP